MIKLNKKFYIICIIFIIVNIYITMFMYDVQNSNKKTNTNYNTNYYIKKELNKNVIEYTNYLDNLYTRNNNDVRMSKTKKIEKFVEDYNEGKIDVLNDIEREKLCRHFDDTVIVGDSIAEQLKYLVFKESYHVKSKTGVTLPRMTEIINEAVAQCPKNIIFLKGLNDAGFYKTSKEYVDYYETIILDIKNRLPNVNIYICSILPPSEKLLKTAKYLWVWEPHNQACHEMCNKLGINYIDIQFLLKENENMRNSDGMHFTWRFYDMWLQYFDILVNY